MKKRKKFANDWGTKARHDSQGTDTQHLNPNNAHKKLEIRTL